jgi:hypothetical protein
VDASSLEEAKSRQEKDGWVEFSHAGQSFSFDLKVVAAALYRVNEVAHANPQTAQHLGESYLEAQSQIAQIRNRASSAASAAKAELERTWNRLLLEYVPDELERRGLAKTADHRNALVSTHPEYKDAEDYHRHLQWVVSDLETKEKRVYGAFTLTRAIMGERFYHRGGSSHGAQQTNKTGRYGEAHY